MATANAPASVRKVKALAAPELEGQDEAGFSRETKILIAGAAVAAIFYVIAALNFLTLVIATVFAVAVAMGLHWLCLRAAFVLMQPATARRIASAARPELVRGATQLARAYASIR